MKYLILTLSLCAAPLWAAQPIPMTGVQQQSLGIRTAPVVDAAQVQGPSYPAEVKVPNAQMMVVSARQEGLLESLRVAAGESVHKGQVLAVIQSPQLLETERRYLGALTRKELANAALKRDRQLRAEGIIAERRYLETRSTQVQVSTEVEQLRQQLSFAGLDGTALKQLTRTRRLSGTLEIRAPLDGVVLAQIATPGQRLGAADPVYEIGRLSPLWLEAHVPLEQVGAIAVGNRVVTEEPRVEGQVITVGRMVHQSDQGVLVRAAVEQGTEQLRPGQFIKARFTGAKTGAVLWRVPRSALVRQRGGSWVFKQVDGGFLPVAVEVRQEESAHLIVAGELAPADVIAVSGTAPLKAAWLGGE